MLVFGKTIMNFKIISFMQKQAENLERCINSSFSIFHILFKKCSCFIKIALLISIYYSSFLHAAKDNLYNVTTFAGSGKASYADGTGTAASFNGPNGITFDSSGNIYVTDRQNYVIRKITPAGVVTTFAGIAGKPGNTDGPGTSAQFSSVIIGIKYDGSNYFYLSDYGNSTIRKVSKSSGAVTTFARSMAFASGITLNSSGDMYVSSPGKNQITKIPSGGLAQVFAGSTTAGSKNGTGTSARFNYPIGITINSAKNLYVADYNNNLIRQITETGVVTTFAGGKSGYANGTGTAAKFRGPTDVQQDKSGNLYVTDAGNNLIRKITPTGIVTTIAGGAGGTTAGAKNGLGTTATFNMPYSLTVDNNGNIYIAEYNNNIIRKLIPNYIGSGTTDTVLTNTDYGTYETINLAGGTMQAGASTLTIANNIVLAAGTTSTINMTNTAGYSLTFSGLISGSGSLVQNGAGKLTLVGANTHTGATTISAGGTLIGDISKSVGVAINGTYDLNGTARTLIGASGAGTIQSSSANAILTLTPSVGKGVLFSGTIASSISSIIAEGSADNVRLQPSNLYAGPITVNPGASFVIGGTSSASQGLSGNITNNSAVHFYVSSNYTYPGVISGAGSVVVADGTSVTLTGANTYTGKTTINAGKILIGNISESVGMNINGIYDLNGTERTLIDPTGAGTIQSSTKNANLILNVKNGSTFSGALTNTINNLTIKGSNILRLLGTNSHSGSTTINTGTTLIGDIAKSSGVIINGAYDLNGAARTLINPSGNGLIKSSVSNATLTITATVGADFLGVIDSTVNGLTLTGNGKFGFAKDQAYTGTTTINSGAHLQIATGGKTGNITSTSIVNNGKISFTRSDPYTYTGVISGTGALHQYKMNTLTLTGANTYTGATTIDKGGTIIGDISKSIGVNINGTYDLNGTERTLIDPAGAGTIKSSTKNASLTLTSQNGSIFSGMIANTISDLAVKGSKTVQLLGTNSYTGSTTINAGSTLIGDISKSINVTINGTYNLNGTPRTLITAGGAGTLQSTKGPAELTLKADGGNGVLFSGTIASSISKIIATGSGANIRLQPTNLYTGPITVTPGTSFIIGGASSNTQGLSGNIENNAEIHFHTIDNYTYPGIMSGIGSVTIANGKSVNLTGANTYTGATTINADRMLLGDISKSVGVAINGTYDLNGSARTLINPSGAGTIQSSTKNTDLTLNVKNSSTFSGAIAKTINNLIVKGSNTLQLLGTNSHSGSTIINAGSTLIGDISNSTNVNVSGTYDLNGRTTTLIDPSGTGTIQSSNKSTPFTLNSKIGSTFSGTIANTINGLTKTGPGTFIVSGTNNMANDTITTITEGTLQIGAEAAGGTITSNTLVNNGVLIFNKSNDYVYPGVISGAGSLIQNGRGKILLTGANTYAGSTRLNAGTLNISSASNLGSGRIILNGGALQANADLTLTQPISLEKEGVIATSNYSVTVSSSITGANSLKKNGNGTLIFTNANTYTGTTNITAGTLKVGSGGTNGSIASKNIINNGNLEFNRSDIITSANVISGTGTLTQSGTGTLVLTEANTYSGQTIINKGTLQIGSGSTTGNITSSNIVNNATLTFSRSDAYTYTGVISGTGALQQTGTGILTLAGANTYTGATTIGAGKTLTGNIASSIGVSIAGTYDLNGTTKTLIDPSGTGIIKSSNTSANLIITSKNNSTFIGTIADTISKLTVNGSRILTLPGISAYTGAISIDAGGSLIGNISNSTDVTVNGTYDLNGSACTLNNLNGSGTIQSSGQKATLTIKSKNTSTFSGELASTLNSVVKSGAGTLTLSSSKAYAGEMIISEGTLALTNTKSLSGVITLSEKTILSIDLADESTFTNPINFNSTTMSDTPATIKVNKPTTFSGPITCNAPPDKAGRLIISGGHPVTLTGKHMGNFAIILSGEGTSVVIKGDANTNTEIVAGSTWFLLNKDKNAAPSK